MRRWWLLVPLVAVAWIAWLAWDYVNEPPFDGGPAYVDVARSRT